MLKDYKYKLLDIMQADRIAMINEWKETHVEALYDISTQREKMSPALSKTRAYHLRAPVIDPSKIVRTESTQHVIECRDTRIMAIFPEMTRFIEEVGRQVFGGWTTLGRVFITRLDANEKIGRHIDQGMYFDTLHRFHVPLETDGALFKWDDDQTVFEQGNLYMFNNSIPHWVENTGGRDRTHLIFDGA